MERTRTAAHLRRPLRARNRAAFGCPGGNADVLHERRGPRPETGAVARATSGGVALHSIRARRRAAGAVWAAAAASPPPSRKRGPRALSRRGSFVSPPCGKPDRRHARRSPRQAGDLRHADVAVALPPGDLRRGRQPMALACKAAPDASAASRVPDSPHARRTAARACRRPPSATMPKRSCPRVREAVALATPATVRGRRARRSAGAGSIASTRAASRAAASKSLTGANPRRTASWRTSGRRGDCGPRRRRQPSAAKG